VLVRHKKTAVSAVKSVPRLKISSLCRRELLHLDDEAQAACNWQLKRLYAIVIYQM